MLAAAASPLMALLPPLDVGHGGQGSSGRFYQYSTLCRGEALVTVTVKINYDLHYVYK